MTVESNKFCQDQRESFWGGSPPPTGPRAPKGHTKDDQARVADPHGRTKDTRGDCVRGKAGPFEGPTGHVLRGSRCQGEVETSYSASLYPNRLSRHE